MANPPNLHIFGTVGGNRSTRRKPTQTRGECANSTHTVTQLGIQIFLSYLPAQGPVYYHVPSAHPGTFESTILSCSTFQAITTLWVKRFFLKSPLNLLSLNMNLCPLMSDLSTEGNSCSLSTLSIHSDCDLCLLANSQSTLSPIPCDGIFSRILLTIPVDGLRSLTVAVLFQGARHPFSQAMGRNIANPTAMLLSSANMLKHLK